MKILLSSPSFAPAVGGVETVGALLAERFQAAGHEVVVATPARGEPAAPLSYPVIRAPMPWALAAAARRADVFVHNHISLKLAWPKLFWPGTPWVVIHHTWIPKVGPHSAAGRLKRLALRAATNIAVSDAIAAALPVPSVVIPNPYADDLFIEHPGARRDRQLVFLGRLVSDKGLPVLLEALARLSLSGTQATLTVIGDGPDAASLRAETRRLGLATQVEFAGVVTGAGLVDLLNRHQILVVPSVWDEPFGVVALEGIACGLVPIVAASGGLPGAAGVCGVVVPKSDPAALAGALERLLKSPPERARLRTHAPAHLARHRRDVVAAEYLAVLERVVGHHRRQIGRVQP
jgi:glycosyltransferase involved in cell wall biosynthesis